MVISPRHPENAPLMQLLYEALRATGLDCRWRTRQDADAAVGGDILVLDTMGELRGCYAAADLAFVGTDHNVLEPLAFGKPVFVCGRWEPTFPSYPVYSALLEAGVIHKVDGFGALGKAWANALDDTDDGLQVAAAGMDQALKPLRGAVARGMSALRDAGLLRAS